MERKRSSQYYQNLIQEQFNLFNSLNSHDCILLSRYVLEPGRSTSRRMWVMPALYPRKAVGCTGLVRSSLGNALHLPLWRLLLFLGKKPLDPWRGAENFLCDCNVLYIHMLDNKTLLVTDAHIFYLNSSSYDTIETDVKSHHVRHVLHLPWCLEKRKWRMSTEKWCVDACIYVASKTQTDKNLQTSFRVTELNWSCIFPLWAQNNFYLRL